MRALRWLRRQWFRHSYRADSARRAVAEWTCKWRGHRPAEVSWIHMFGQRWTRVYCPRCDATRPAREVADWYQRWVAEAGEEWAGVKDLPHAGPPPAFCDVCIAGDGDGRCQRCGCSVGMPGCQCPEGVVTGPCLA